MTQEEVTHQLKLLKIHRDVIEVYKSQLRTLGAYAPPHVFIGIQEAREAIAAIKTRIPAISDSPGDFADAWERQFEMKDV